MIRDEHDVLLVVARDNVQGLHMLNRVMLLNLIRYSN